MATIGETELHIKILHTFFEVTEKIPKCNYLAINNT